MKSSYVEVILWAKSLDFRLLQMLHVLLLHWFFFYWKCMILKRVNIMKRSPNAERDSPTHLLFQPSIFER